ncbi:hypothetical protein KAR91_60210 [Candidatus Pacearchaeota archaeon]|nr:hypothetical protein [Candidatus Pacearchaeota archaeon]
MDKLKIRCRVWGSDAEVMPATSNGKVVTINNIITLPSRNVKGSDNGMHSTRLFKNLQENLVWVLFWHISDPRSALPGGAYSL